MDVMCGRGCSGGGGGGLSLVHPGYFGCQQSACQHVSLSACQLVSLSACQQSACSAVSCAKGGQNGPPGTDFGAVPMGPRPNMFRWVS
jgi:hypothetical protein